MARTSGNKNPIHFDSVFASETVTTILLVIFTCRQRHTCDHVARDARITMGELIILIRRLSLGMWDSDSENSCVIAVSSGLRKQ